MAPADESNGSPWLPPGVADGLLLDEADPWWEAPEPVEPADADTLFGPPDPASRSLAGHWTAVTWAAKELRDGSRSGFEERGLLDVQAPGPVLAAFTSDAFDEGLARLNDDELAGVIAAVRKLSSWQAGLELTAISELDRRRQASARPGSSRDQDHINTELALSLTMTERSAGALVELARGVARLSGVQTALLAGKIDRARAAVFAEELAALDIILANAIVAALVGPAARMTTAQLRAAIRRLILELFPGAMRERAARARRLARVEAWPEISGNAGLAGRELSPADVITADKRITAMARALKAAGSALTMDELRAAAFVGLLTGRDPAVTLPEGNTVSPGTDAGGPATDGPAGLWSALTGSVQLTLPLKTWLGWSDSPGEVRGYGPLPGDICRDLAKRVTGPGARWCLTLTGEDGRAAAHACARAGPGPPGAGTQEWLAGLNLAWLEHGTCGHSRQTVAYRPGRTLRHLINIRQRTCANPICRRPAEECDLDHTIPYDQGGRTCECNLAPVCRRHHRCKQAPGWQLAQSEPGYLIWTAPSGRSYPGQPDLYPI